MSRSSAFRRGDGTLAAERREKAEARASRSVTQLFEHKILCLMWGGHSCPPRAGGSFAAAIQCQTHKAVVTDTVTRAGRPRPHQHNLTLRWWLRPSIFRIGND